MSQHPIVPTPGNNLTTGNNLIKTGNQLLKKGKYNAEIRRDRPTAIVFLIDQSGSMSAGGLQYRGSTLNKATAVARILNQTLEEIISKSKKDYGLGNYIDIAVIGYGQNSKSADFISKSINGTVWLSLSELEQKAIIKTFKVIKKVRGGGEKEQEETQHWWFEAIAANQTPMCDALKKATNLLKEWVGKNQDSYPPTVINITDGAATDATNEKLLDAANSLKDLSTNDGNVLLFNCHIEDHDGDALCFPTTESDLPDDKYAQLLFRMSSILPEKYQQEIKKQRSISSDINFVGMSFKSGVGELIKMIDVGTITVQNQIKHS
ncbi:MAG: VWA domain-containing protein [Sphingobacteriales bacterium]|nr:MAG: VWA domain-containing protein [Sphingobacteriales bacterium]